MGFNSRVLQYFPVDHHNYCSNAHNDTLYLVYTSTPIYIMQAVNIKLRISSLTIYCGLGNDMKREQVIPAPLKIRIDGYVNYLIVTVTRSYLSTAFLGTAPSPYAQ